ncbi:MAG: hypothetical protein WC849_02430 [Candidatus Paceibacterota bacterium]
MSTKKVHYYCKKCETHGLAIVPKSFSEADVIMFIFDKHASPNNNCTPKRDNFVFSNSFDTCLKKQGGLSVLFESTGSRLMKMMAHQI